MRPFVAWSQPVHDTSLVFTRTNLSSVPGHDTRLVFTRTNLSSVPGHDTSLVFTRTNLSSVPGLAFCNLTVSMKYIDQEPSYLVWFLVYIFIDSKQSSPQCRGMQTLKQKSMRNFPISSLIIRNNRHLVFSWRMK